ncbi:TatD family hydrolase [Noviherbaspirillum sp.]|jgi:TatD DNase family protein|uniref:TatD family hydrolase n=1 Tax=Noviherbaspirillum sp. TaxID=1926288 RepID=UPI0025FD7CDE|nr:TatD family hydrolase [Noviherbaspirillum sp.]
MWIDTHCHLDASEFAGESDAVAARAARQNVSQIVIPAVACSNFAAVQNLTRQNTNCTYALGIHPIFVPQATDSDLEAVREAVRQAMDDAHFVAVGEIGLDFFLPDLSSGPMREKQEFFYSEQLKIAREFELPVLLHIRRSQDTILKYLRRITVPGGIAHAFNGSFQQADAFIGLGFKLGFGGAMTFPRALQIRRLAAELPQEALVLETDAPDIPPAWIHRMRNSPEELPRIGQVLAELRGIAAESVAQITSDNAREVLPRLIHVA